jgi:hypothetical protein
MSDAESGLRLEGISVTCQSTNRIDHQPEYHSFRIVGTFFNATSSSRSVKRSSEVSFGHRNISSAAFSLLLVIASLKEDAMEASTGERATIVGEANTPASSLFNFLEKLADPLPDWLKRLFGDCRIFQEYKEQSLQLKGHGPEYLVTYLTARHIKVLVGDRNATAQERLAICKAIVAKAKGTKLNSDQSKSRWSGFEVPDIKLNPSTAAIPTNLWINARFGQEVRRGISGFHDEPFLDPRNRVQIDAISVGGSIILFWVTKRRWLQQVYPEPEKTFQDPKDQRKIEYSEDFKPDYSRVVIPEKDFFPLRPPSDLEADWDVCILLSAPIEQQLPATKELGKIVMNQIKDLPLSSFRDSCDASANLPQQEDSSPRRRLEFPEMEISAAHLLRSGLCRTLTGYAVHVVILPIFLSQT